MTLSRLWNWKSAILSVLLRSPIFALAALRAGVRAAAAAGAVDMTFRLVAAGAIGAMTEYISSLKPTWRTTLVAVLGVPLTAHTVEAIVHSQAATPRWREGLLVSVLVSVVSTMFNLYAMRHKALIAGSGGRPITDDLRRLPRLIAGFVRHPFTF